MKKFFQIAVVTLFLVVAYSTTSKAQDVNLGAGLIYGSEIENVGLQARADIGLSDSWRLAPALNFFFPKSVGNVDLNWFAINLDANYIIPVDSDVVGLYGIAGLNIGFLSVDYEDDFFDDNNDTELGLNLGIGAEFNIESSVTPSSNLSMLSEMPIRQLLQQA
ncbi:outer membrane beta-barrel protein [Roseivirga sp. BDSF3-8]|uniref:outer membrane beta-barrel protein n=1 Tax=Roseivirga sp. BDSF3-8 TaxID=3241598 RepID=UPI003531B3C4